MTGWAFLGHLPAGEPITETRAGSGSLADACLESDSPWPRLRRGSSTASRRPWRGRSRRRSSPRVAYSCTWSRRSWWSSSPPPAFDGGAAVSPDVAAPDAGPRRTEGRAGRRAGRAVRRGGNVIAAALAGCAALFGYLQGDVPARRQHGGRERRRRPRSAGSRTSTTSPAERPPTTVIRARAFSVSPCFSRTGGSPSSPPRWSCSTSPTRRCCRFDGRSRRRPGQAASADVGVHHHGPGRWCRSARNGRLRRPGGAADVLIGFGVLPIQGLLYAQA